MLWGVTCHGILVALGEVIVKTSRLLRLMMVWAWLVVTSAGLALAQQYTITDLGVLKGDNESSGFWINNSGQVVGCSDTQTSQGYLTPVN
jgi:hypothetical protein